MAKNSFNTSTVHLTIFFVLAAILITLSFPSEGKFKYSFSEGKPWKYGLLTAPFDITVYKTDAEVSAEKDSIVKFVKPFYFSMDENAVSSATESLTEFYEREGRSANIPYACYDYLLKQLQSIYTDGIIPLGDYQNMEEKNISEIRLKSDNLAVTRLVKSFYTVRSAYETIIKKRPSHIGEEELKKLNVSNYLQHNVSYDKELSDKALNEHLSKVMLSVGVVQTGAKIIDRGEIVDLNAFRILSSLQKQTQERLGSTQYQASLILGEGILICVFMAAFFFYLFLFRPREFANRKNTIFMLLNITIICVITGFFSTDKGFFNAYIIPFAIPTIMIRTFIDSRTAMVTHSVIVLICSLMVPYPSEFILLQFAAGFTAIFGLKDLTERSQLFRCSFLVLLAYIITYVGIVLCDEGDITKLNWRMFVYFGINFIFLTFTYLLVYLVEKSFGFISGVSMVELSNVNTNPLLLELSEKAPGTHQHSMQVANLASSVALKIGADATLVRTGALYHDVGKLFQPEYFTENQMAGFNPLNQLSYVESAQIIINHVQKGIELAKQHRVPEQIIDFIRTHHGTGKVGYFYTMYKNEHPDEEIDDQLFSYQGPNPSTKEQAILMIADTVEAASKSLKEYTETNIRDLVNRLVDGKVEEGLLNDAPITLQELKVTKEVLIEKLMGMYHTRIAYPELRESKLN